MSRSEGDVLARNSIIVDGNLSSAGCVRVRRLPQGLVVTVYRSTIATRLMTVREASGISDHRAYSSVARSDRRKDPSDWLHRLSDSRRPLRRLRYSNDRPALPGRNHGPRRHLLRPELPPGPQESRRKLEPPPIRSGCPICRPEDGMRGTEEPIPLAARRCRSRNSGAACCHTSRPLLRASRYPR